MLQQIVYLIHIFLFIRSKFYWQITIGNENKCTVSTLFGAVLSILDFDNTSGRIDSILTSVRIKGW